MDVGKLTVALLVLFCGIAHGRGGLDVNRVASGVLDSGHAVSVATGRALKGLRRMQKVNGRNLAEIDEVYKCM